MYQPESLSDEPGVFKNFTDTSGFCRCCDIEVLRCFSVQQIANSAADNVGLITCIM